MKRIFLFALALVCVFGTTACKKQEKQDTTFLGKIKGDKYENKLLGFGFTLPTGWTFYSDDELREMNDADEDMSLQEYAKQMAEEDVLYVMFAVDAQTGRSVNIVLEKVGYSGPNIKTAEEYMRNSITGLKAAFEELGVESVTAHHIEVSLAGEKVPGVKLTCHLPNGIMYERVLCKRAGDYFVCITIANTGADTPVDILNQFYSLD